MRQSAEARRAANNCKGLSECGNPRWENSPAGLEPPESARHSMLVDMTTIATILLALLLALAAGCGGPASARTTVPTLPSPSATPRLDTLRLEPTLTARRFQAPTNLVQLQNGRALVTEQAGRVWAFNELHPDPDTVSEFLDITDRVNSRGSEEGLLGIALDPKNDRHLYLHYSAAKPRRSVVSRFTLSPDHSAADPDSELVILEVAQPYPNHNGGQLAFGPDGYLYVGLGDGGSAGDPPGNGQDPTTLLGSILRIDVSQATPQRPYAIPPDNPFADPPEADPPKADAEIWAYGLRNPWRFSFDRDTGELWAGDVGQNRWEEIDLIQRGANYGWNVLEGNHCFRPRDGCQREGMTPPVWEYSLDGEPCSVIGGYVYRGSAIPWLNGAYVYGDFCSGKLFGLRYAKGKVVEHVQLADTGRRIMSFAQDNDGELYLLSQKSGIYRLTN